LALAFPGEMAVSWWVGTPVLLPGKGHVGNIGHEMMKLPKNFWTYAKVGFLAVSVILSLVAGPEPIDSGDSPLPFWPVILPVVFFGLFLSPYLCAFVATELYVTASPWPAFPFSVFRDPLPFYHLGAWACFAYAAPQTYQAFTPYDHNRMVVALVTWSCGVGGLLGITRAKRGLERRMDASRG
jgi:hypothetical protein